MNTCINCDKPTSGRYCSNLCEDMDSHPAPRDDMEVMTGGGNTDNRINRQRVLKHRHDDGQCTYCPPHRGENQNNHDGRFINGVFVKSKDKDRK